MIHPPHLHGQHEHSHGHGHSQGHGHGHAIHASHGHSATAPTMTGYIAFGLSQPRELATSVAALGLAIAVFLYGYSVESMALQCSALLFLFDSLGVGNAVLSRYLALNGSFQPDNTRPFGLQRLDVVYAFANSLSLLFSGLYAVKEALEAVLEQEDHKHGQVQMTSFVVPVMAALLGSVLILFCRIHELYFPLVSRRSFDDKLHNPFVQAHGISAIILLIVHWIQAMFSSAPSSTIEHVAPASDALGALALGLTFMWLAVPLATATGSILLQVTPPTLQKGLDRLVGEVACLHGIAEVSKVHVWSPSLNRLSGILHVHYRAGGDVDALRLAVRSKVTSRFPADWWIEMVEVAPSFS
ncbi:cation efflux protein [Blastocladiella britannica]|nr:cation efflux protein [Blastocladiella britannica]